MALVDLRMHSLSLGFIALTALSTFGLASAARAESDASTTTPRDPRIGSLIETLGQTKTPSAVAISPDGESVAWSVRSHGSTQIHLSDALNPDPAKEKIVSTGSGATDCSSADPKWSPDGESLAFVSDCAAKTDQSGQDQIFLWSKSTGESKQLTHLVGNIDSLAWSPDGKSVGFLFVENATRSAGALAAMKPWSGVIGEDGVEIQRVALVDLASGSFTQVSPANLHVYEFDWSPDSKQLAFVAANPPGENNWWVAQLYKQQLNGNPPQSILDTTKISGSLHGLQIAVPRWSPDGKQIAFIGGLMSDQGSTGGGIYLLPSTGGKPKKPTPH